MTYAEKINRIYLSGQQEKFCDHSTLRQADSAKAKILDKAETSVLAIKDRIGAQTQLAVNYFKWSFLPGDIVRIPNALYDRSRTDAAPGAPAIELTEANMLAAIRAKPDKFVHVPDCTYVQIVDAKPESKTKIHISGKFYSPYTSCLQGFPLPLCLTQDFLCVCVCACLCVSGGHVRLFA